ncbi:MAG: HAD hydrolase family protein [Clostridia bacterium]|nr:HAD hydrolase family protein [Clostridia bacterium]
MKTSDKKAFFFDFDGTIWFGRYGERTLKALKELHGKGHLLFYNSGRSRGNTRFDNVYEIPFDGYLCGGCLAVTNSGEVLYRSDISREVISATLEIEKRFDLLMLYEGVDGVYKRKGILSWLNGEELDDIFLLKDVEAYPVSKLSLLKKRGQNGEYLPIPKEALDLLAEHYILIDFEGYVECMQKGHGKDVIILKTVEKLNVALKNTYAFGDSLNDLPMFNVCAKCVAIGHSPKELKKCASYVTSEEEDGVWEALKAFNLI